MGNNQIFTVNSVNLSKLLSSLNECTEWGQITILDAIAIYVPQNESEAEMVIDKTIPRLQHINPAVVLCAIRVI
jgi:vesicle coat complex subunit